MEEKAGARPPRREKGMFQAMKNKMKRISGLLLALALIVSLLCGTASASSDPRSMLHEPTDLAGVCAEGDHVAAFRYDGQCVASGDDRFGECEILYWANIVKLAAGWNHTVGMRADGTAIALGDNSDGRCNVRGWTDLVDIAANDTYTIGLKSDGTIVSAGNNPCGSYAGWDDVTAIAAGQKHTLGLRSDGTVLAKGDNAYGQCDVSGWKDVTAVFAGETYSLGIRKDGTVAAAGQVYDLNCSAASLVDGWEDVISLSTSWDHVVGLRSDGTVLAAGSNSHGQLEVSGWKDVVSVAAGSKFTVGVLSDGTAVAVGSNSYGQLNVDTWDFYPYGEGFRFGMDYCPVQMPNSWEGKVTMTHHEEKGHCFYSVFHKATGKWLLTVELYQMDATDFYSEDFVPTLKDTANGKGKVYITDMSSYAVAWTGYAVTHLEARSSDEEEYNAMLEKLLQVTMSAKINDQAAKPWFHAYVP